MGHGHHIMGFDENRIRMGRGKGRMHQGAQESELFGWYILLFMAVCDVAVPTCLRIADAEFILFIDFCRLIRVSQQIVQKSPQPGISRFWIRCEPDNAGPCAYPDLNPAGRAETAEFDSLTGNSEPSAPGQTANGAV